MVIVPAGSFTMGSPTDEPERESLQAGTESPRHEVRIAKPFAVGRSAVTRAQFAKFVEATGHKTDGGCWTWAPGSEWKEDKSASWRSPGFDQDDSHPVVCVNWNDAKAYVPGWRTRRGNPIAFFLRPRRNMWRGLEPRRPSGGDRRSRLNRPITMGPLFTLAAGLRANTGRRQFRRIRSSRIPGGFIRSMGMCGAGLRIAGTAPMTGRRSMVPLGRAEIAAVVFFAAGPGSTLRGASALRTATGSL